MKILVRNNIVRILTICLLVCFFGCKTTKESASLAGKSDSEIIRSIIGQSIQFNTISGKLNAEIKTPQKSLGSKATLKIIKNEKIQLSFQPFLGVEAFKVEFTPDSIKFLDRFNHRYAAENISELKEGTELDFDFFSLQALFTNQLFIAGKQTITEEVSSGIFSIERAKDKALIHARDRQDIDYLFTGDYTGKIQSLYISAGKQQTGASLLSQYSDFQKVSESQVFPMNMVITLKTPSEGEVRLRFSYSKINLDTDFDTDFNIPAKYKRIRVSDAFNLIRNL